MQQRELWAYFLDKSTHRSKPFDRSFVWVTKKDFESVAGYFIEEFNILHLDTKSFRTRKYFLHIHAIEQGEYIFVHRDFGNVAYFLPLGVIHLFVDVIPYFVFARVKGVPFRSIFTRPQ
jgi:hypothetical protein